MLKKLSQIFSSPDLRNKILVSLFIVVIARFLAHIPMPGVNTEELKNFFSRNQIFGFLNMFSGGAMENFSLIMMGVGPFITASIIFQLLQMIVPSIEALSKEGERGRQKINQWTRYAAVPLAIIQAFGTTALLKNQGVITNLSGLPFITMLISVTAGTMLLMYLGEILSEKGIGNGMSIIIAVGILSGYPMNIRNTAAVIGTDKALGLILFIAILVVVIALIVIMNEGVRQIPISYARRTRGTKSYGGVDTYLPLRVNTGGVVPIIFALSFMLFPGIIAKFFTAARSPWLSDMAFKVSAFFSNNTYYGIIYFIATIIFTYFYASIIFKPTEVAENLQKQGGFIPGIRPGTETASFLAKVLNRITFVGALFLGFIAVLPFIVQSLTQINTIVIGGTGMLIIVSVIIETSRQIKAQLLMRTYDTY
ncbi:MAG: preprotein translocase subunit SecY [Patescibacteria group bacterium]|jgi:preprotein translocase subunit SecY